MNRKVILITGASAGIGNETSKKLLSEGHIVYAATVASFLGVTLEAAQSLKK